MMRWESLLRESVQLGGSVVFIADQAPAEMPQYMDALEQHFRYEVPVVKRDAKDLQAGVFRTKAADLIVLFASQTSLLSQLNPVLQGQRWVLALDQDFVKTHEVDFIWSGCNLAEWTALLEELKKNGLAKPHISQYAGVHQAPCLFLDRDDVVVKNVPYNKDPQKVELMPGAAELINRAHAKGYWVALVTNQSGLGRGWISWEEYRLVHQKMLALLAEQGAWLDESIWAGFMESNEPVGPLFAGLRKPRAGMFQWVDDKLYVDMRNSIMIGDSPTDLIAAHVAGVKNLYLLVHDKGTQAQMALEAFKKEDASLVYRVIENLSSIF